jgi:hypothetical protein
MITSMMLALLCHINETKHHTSSIRIELYSMWISQGENSKNDYQISNDVTCMLIFNNLIRT